MEELLQAWDFLNAGVDPWIWNCFPYSMVWSIWLSRNDVVFGNKVFKPEEDMDLAKSRMAWWVKSLWEDCPFSIAQIALNLGILVIPRKSKLLRSKEWAPPGDGLLKFNVDGASLGNPGERGIGGVLRNDKGYVLG